MKEDYLWWREGSKRRKPKSIIVSAWKAFVAMPLYRMFPKQTGTTPIESPRYSTPAKIPTPLPVLLSGSTRC